MASYPIYTHRTVRIHLTLHGVFGARVPRQCWKNYCAPTSGHLALKPVGFNRYRKNKGKHLRKAGEMSRSKWKAKGSLTQQSQVGMFKFPRTAGGGKKMKLQNQNFDPAIEGFDFFCLLGRGLSGPPFVKKKVWFLGSKLACLGATKSWWKTDEITDMSFGGLFLI